MTALSAADSGHVKSQQLVETKNRLTAGSGVLLVCKLSYSAARRRKNVTQQRTSATEALEAPEQSVTDNI